MKSVTKILEERTSSAMCAASGLDDCVALVRPAADARFGDYQANGVMALAKHIKSSPRALAEQVVRSLDVSDMCEKPEVAGPGFINFRLKPSFLAERLIKMHSDAERLGIDKAKKPQTIVVDFSGPNIAKQMHVGHLRSTIIGDCICRLLDILGHKVIRQNHIGDWGTQFGMLVLHLHETAFFKMQDESGINTIEEALRSIHISDLEEFYRDAKFEFDRDPVFAEEARKRVVELHNRSNKHTLEYWSYIVNESRKHYQQIYETIGVNLKKSDERGESFYADKLATVVEELKNKNLAEESDGAICVFPEGFKNKQGERLPLIVQKSDGAYLYATTDLAALRYRVDELKADGIIYVTDSRQKLHFEMVFTVARMAGWAKEKTDLVHVTFGSVLGEGGTPLKTREGENVKLKELLDEAVERARDIVEEKNPGLSREEKEVIAKAVGIGAVKYADYSNNRTSDYVFSFDKMLAMDGNTAPYMQYAYARIKSIERKARQKEVDIETELAGLRDLNLSEGAEIDMAKHLVRYGEAVNSAIGDYRPNYVTAYLFDLAQKFSSFYNSCPVIGADESKRPTRLLLCDLTEKTIRHGLSELLGITVVEQM